MNLISANQALTQRWTPKVTVNDIEQDPVVKKNTDVTIKLKLLLTDGGAVDRSDAVEDVMAKITIENAATYEVSASGDMTMNPDNKEFSFDYSTGVHQGEWTVHVEIIQKENNMPVHTVDQHCSARNCRSAGTG